MDLPEKACVRESCGMRRLERWTEEKGSKSEGSVVAGLVVADDLGFLGFGDEEHSFVGSLAGMVTSGGAFGFLNSFCRLKLWFAELDMPRSSRPPFGLLAAFKTSSRENAGLTEVCWLEEVALAFASAAVFFKESSFS